MTMVEVLIALTLSGFVGSLAVGIVMTQQRVYRANVARFGRVATYRDAAALFPSELGELNPGDSLGADLELLGTSTVVYRAMRSVRFLCRPPDTVGLEVTASTPWLGLRDIDPLVDSVLVFAGGDLMSKADDTWLHADALAVRGATCPGGTPGLRIALRGVTPSRLARVHAGAPLRAYVPAEIGSYRDARGDWWVGMRGYQKVSGRWPVRQPVFGPLEPSGLAFELYRSDGTVTASVPEATHIGVRLTPLGAGAGGVALPFPDILIAFRNRRRP